MSPLYRRGEAIKAGFRAEGWAKKRERALFTRVADYQAVIMWRSPSHAHIHKHTHKKSAQKCVCAHTHSSIVWINLRFY